MEERISEYPERIQSEQIISAYRQSEQIISAYRSAQDSEERQIERRQWFEEAERRKKLKENYRRALTKGAADVAYGRVMLLGPAGVGKTCLRRGLMRLPFDSKTNSTILADVTSVKPTVDTTDHDQPQQAEAARSLSCEWLTHGWSKVSEEDEINELAQLMVLAETDLKASKDELIEPASYEASSTDKPETTGSLLSLKSLQESNVVQKAIRKAMQLKTKKDDVHSECLPLFHLWDCGGQPVFLEVLPIFLTAHTIYLQLFNAAIDLTQPWKSVYNREGRQFVDTETNMSTLQMMEKWISLIYSYLLEVDEAGVDPGYPRIIPIGTRGDELKKQGKKPEDIIGLVQKCIEGKATMHILKQPFIIDNTTSGDKKNEDPGYAIIRKEIFDITFEKLKKKTPIAWILYRKFLQLLAKASHTDIISLDDAIAIGLIAKVERDEIPSVLKFYHELGVLLYYPYIKGLEHKIILNPKWFVESLGKVLTLPGPKEEQFEDKVEWELLRSKGILVQKLYTTVWGKCQGVEPEEFIELLTHFQLAVEVKTKEYFNKSVKQFFVPGVLPYVPADYQRRSDATICSHETRPHPLHSILRSCKVHAQLFMHIIQVRASGDHGGSRPPLADHNAENNSAVKPATLHITFDGGFTIPGFFTRLSTSMLLNKKGSPELELHFDKNRQNIFHNQVSYNMKSKPPCLVTITENTDVIEVTLQCPSNPPLEKLQKCCTSLKTLCEARCKDVENCLQFLHSNISKICSFKLKVVCQAAECRLQSEQVHYLIDNESDDDTVDGSVHIREVMCDDNKFEPRKITPEEACWYTSCKPTSEGQKQSKLPIGITHSKADENLQNNQLQQSHSGSVNNEHADSSKPIAIDVSKVYDLLKDKSARWNDIGLELHVTVDFREGLKQDFSSNQIKLEAVLIKWKESQCSSFSWDTIIKVLKQLEWNDKVKDVEENYL